VLGGEVTFTVNAMDTRNSLQIIARRLQIFLLLLPSTFSFTDTYSEFPQIRMIVTFYHKVLNIYVSTLLFEKISATAMRLWTPALSRLGSNTEKS
jgi:hypothetical protein